MAEKTKLGQLIVQALAASPGMNDVDCATACVAGIEPNETWHAFLTRTRKILVADYGYQKVKPGSGGEPHQDTVVPPGLGVNGRLTADDATMSFLRSHGYVGAAFALSQPTTSQERRRQLVAEQVTGRYTSAPPSAALSLLASARAMPAASREAAVASLMNPYGVRLSATDADRTGKPKISPDRHRAIMKELGYPDRKEGDEADLDAELAALAGPARTEQPSPAEPMELPDLLRDQLNGKPRAQLERLLTRASKVESFGTSGEQLRKTIYELTDKLKNKDYRPAKEEMYSLLRSMRACERSAERTATIA